MVKIQNYDFQGPFSLNTSLNDVAGVYVVYTSQNWLDVGETDKLGTRISNHERRPEWLRNASGQPIWLAFLGVGETRLRLAIESQLRLLLAPVCGEK